MNIKALSKNGLIEIEFIDSPTRVFFLISDEKTETEGQVDPIEVTIKQSNENETKNINCPYVTTIQNEHYFSFNYHIVSQISMNLLQSPVGGIRSYHKIN